MTKLETKETIIEDAVEAALPIRPEAEFEVNYHKFICSILKTSMEKRLDIIQDILGDTTDEPQQIRSLSIFVDALIETYRSVRKTL
jgi:hypothetical protein